MSDKKHIDRLFQEKFKDFDVTPNDKVWEGIEARLDKKKKKHSYTIIYNARDKLANCLISKVKQTISSLNYPIYLQFGSGNSRISLSLFLD